MILFRNIILPIHIEMSHMKKLDISLTSFMNCTAVHCAVFNEKCKHRKRICLVSKL